jgi:hypothetical protein
VELNNAFPEKVNCGMPVTIPVELPVSVTSSAFAIPWLDAITVSIAMPSKSLLIEKIEVAILVLLYTTNQYETSVTFEVLCSAFQNPLGTCG